MFFFAKPSDRSLSIQEYPRRPPSQTSSTIPKVDGPEAIKIN